MISFQACKKSDSSTPAPTMTTQSLPNPDGSWTVTVIDSFQCSCPINSHKTIIVSGGNFSDTLTKYNSSGCSEYILINGTITKGNVHLVVNCNEGIFGSCCNGWNSCDVGYIDPTITPLKCIVQSYWGQLSFQKQ